MKIAAINQPNRLRLTPVEDLLSLTEDSTDSWKATQTGYFTIIKDADQARELLDKIYKLGGKDPGNSIYDVINTIKSPTVLYVETELGRDSDRIEFTPLDEDTLKHMLAGVQALTIEKTGSHQDIN